MTERIARWVVRAVCPHGMDVGIPFDDLGYIVVPKDTACEELHKQEAGPPKGPGPRAERRLARKFRRQLKRL